MTATTDVVQRKSVLETYRTRGYFFREAAMLTILIGFCYFLLIPVYPAFLTLFWRLQYRN